MGADTPGSLHLLGMPVPAMRLLAYLLTPDEQKSCATRLMNQLLKNVRCACRQWRISGGECGAGQLVGLLVCRLLSQPRYHGMHCQSAAHDTVSRAPAACTTTSSRPAGYRQAQTSTSLRRASSQSGRTRPASTAASGRSWCPAATSRSWTSSGCTRCVPGTGPAWWRVMDRHIWHANTAAARSSCASIIGRRFMLQQQG
jgi:hypothetical protein